MKEFFERHNARLDMNDLRRFVGILIDDLRPILVDYEFVVRLLDTPEQEAGFDDRIRAAISGNKVFWESEARKLHVPVVHQAKGLALITGAPPPGHERPEALEPVLPEIIRLSLEKILLYKINITDQETGLHNGYYFRTYLKKSLETIHRQTLDSGRLKPLRLGEKEDSAGLMVMLAEVDGFDELAVKHGRLEAVRVLKTLAERFNHEAAGTVCLARLDAGRLGIVTRRVDPDACFETAKKVADRPNDTEDEIWSGVRLAIGLTGYPADFPEGIDRVEGESLRSDDLARLLVVHAELALHQALTDKDETVFSFRDVLHRGGRVVQVLPYNRVVVNIGRVAGAREGQVFIVKQTGGVDEVDYKGEVALFEVQEDFALGELINLRSSLSRIEPGDTLVLSRFSLEEPRGEDGSLDSLLGIPDHHGFIRLMTERMADEDAFAVVLIRVDGYDRYRTTMGRLESDRQFKALYENLMRLIPGNSIVGRFSGESLSVFSPGLTEGEAGALAESWRNEITGRLHQTCSFGVAAFPCGLFNGSEIINNAQKALEHAAFLGPASVVVFDSVSLNISGDKLFESGDTEGAVEEYNRALELNPGDVNVLNSLGVCYGHLGRVATALDMFARVLDLEPDNLMAHYNIGFALATEGRLGEALENLRRAAHMDPGHFDVLFQLGRIAFELDLVDEALDNFERAAALADRRTVVFRHLGQALLRMERTEEAFDAYKAAVRFDPEDASSLSQLGVLYLERETDLDVALSLLRQSVDLDRTNSLFHHRLARALDLAGDLKEAELEYGQAIDMGARTREIYYDLGRVIREQGRLDEAENWFRESMAVDPEFKPAAEALEARVKA